MGSLNLADIRRSAASFGDMAARAGISTALEEHRVHTCTIYPSTTSGSSRATPRNACAAKWVAASERLRRGQAVERGAPLYQSVVTAARVRYRRISRDGRWRALPKLLSPMLLLLCLLTAAADVACRTDTKAACCTGPPCINMGDKGGRPLQPPHT